MDSADLLLDTLRSGSEPDHADLRRRWGAAAIEQVDPLVQYEECSLWLYRRLVDLELLHHVQPDLQAELGTRARHIAAHNLLVDAQRDAVIRTLHRLEIPHVLLKGSALRLLGERIPYADGRPVGDVDVLIPAEWIEGAWERLREARFEVATPDEARYEGHHHLPPLTDRLHVMVELHHSISGAVAPRDAWTRMTAKAIELSHEGVPTLIPSPTELLWHALTHAVAMGPIGFRLRLFQDAALIMASGETVDWETLRGRLESPEISDASLAQRWLSAAADLAGHAALPSWLLAGPRFDLSRALSWRALVTSRLAAAEITEGNGDSTSAVRSTRLLIEEGTRADLGLGLTPPKWGKTPIARVGRRLAAGAARVAYVGWRFVSRGRMEGGQEGQ